jgi:MFS family permease
MLYSMVIPAAQKDLGMSSATAGLIMSFTLLAAAAGGIGFGFVADRLGRTRALSLSILIYTVCTGLCAFVHTVPQLAICRFLLGIGMGGEWAAGAALVAETWPQQHRPSGTRWLQELSRSSCRTSAGALFFLRACSRR